MSAERSAERRAGPVAGIVLAAGASRRMEGLPKLLLPFGESTVVGSAVDAAARAGLRPLIAVLGHRAAEVREALAGSAASCVENPDYRAGQGSSVAVGARAVRATAGGGEGVALLLGDEPGMRPAAIRAVVAEWKVSGARAARALYRDRPGHPVVFRRDLWQDLAELEGEGGAAGLLAILGAEVRDVRLEEPAPIDVDTPADYERAVARWRG
ncbi:MAG: NTP transferase domain-containing protein [Gemmatimonadota bacterium]